MKQLKMKQQTKHTKKSRCILMLLGTLFASILRNAIAGKGVVRTGEDF